MKVVGIVAEYNPFHKGHAYQIQKIREIYGEDTAIVCVMSGDYVQRGEPAIFSKFARAEAAVRCGADLVVELPVPFSLASAEGFARGAVAVLNGLGIVDHLVFGSESADLEALEQTANALLQPEFHGLVKELLETGCSYPTARSRALERLLGGSMVTTPNDNLGVEYIKAIRQLNSSMKPALIRREGAMHDMNGDGELRSGSELRRMIRAGERYTDYIPARAAAVYGNALAEGLGPVSAQSLEQGILSRLRMLPEERFARLPDASEGLENRLYTACRREATLEGIYDAVKSKRYAHARIRRMTMCAALGIENEDQTLDGLYLRVLALGRRGGKLLRQSESVRSLPVISKPAAARQLPSKARRLFELTAAARDLYVLGYANEAHRMGGTDWTTSPVFVEETLLH